MTFTFLKILEIIRVIEYGVIAVYGVEHLSVLAVGTGYHTLLPVDLHCTCTSGTYGIYRVFLTLSLELLYSVAVLFVETLLDEFAACFLLLLSYDALGLLLFTGDCLLLFSPLSDH